jgi:hypothetical protein
MTMSTDQSNLNLKLKQSRRYLKSDTESTIFAQLEIFSDETTKIIQKNLHYCIVIDCSGSMALGGNMDQAKNAAINLVRGLPSTSIVSIVAFDDNVHVILDPKPASERLYIENMINSIKTGAATAMHAGISKAFDMIQQSSNTINRLVVITDGLPNVPPCRDEDFIQLAKKIRNCGITIGTVGIGAFYGEDLLMKISEFGGGKWEHVSNVNDLTKIVKDHATQMQNTIIINPELQITLMDTAELLDAIIAKPRRMQVDDLRTNNNVISIGLKDIIKNESHAIALKIKVPAGNGKNIPLLTAKILEGNNVCAGPKTIEISYTFDKSLYGKDDENISNAFRGNETILLQRKAINGDTIAAERAKTIIKVLEKPGKLKGLARATVVLANKIAGKIVPELTESEKKELSHQTTIIETEKEEN